MPVKLKFDIFVAMGNTIGFGPANVRGRNLSHLVRELNATARAWIFCPMVTAGILLGSAQFSWSQEQIGDAKVVINVVEGNLSAGNEAPVVQGDNVFLNESLRSNPDSKANLLLNDNTNLTVGPGSTIKLDEFVYAGPQKPGTITLNMAKGTLRFITGYANKRAYTILTPTAALGVRGTILRVEVTPGETKVINEEGTAIVCLRQNNEYVTVEELRRRCRGREVEQANLTVSEIRRRKCPCTTLLLPNQEATISSSQIGVAEAPLNAISEPFITEGFGLGGTVVGTPLVAAGVAGVAVIAAVAVAVSSSNSSGTPPVAPVSPP
jgi:hypothetical protein